MTLPVSELARSTRRRRMPLVWLLVIALVVAAALPFILTVEPPSPPEGWHVNVRWATSVTDAERAQLEREYDLILLQPHSERTFVYRLGDPSSAAIRALVTDPRTEDTNGIDRERYRVSEPRVTLWEQYLETHPDAADRLDDLRSVRTAFAAVAVIALLAASRRRLFAAALSRGIPELSAAGLALYRLALAVALMAAVLEYADLPDTPFPRELHRSYDWFANWDWVHALASNPALEQWTTPVSLVLLGMFGAGVLARPSYLLLLGVLTAHVFVVLQHKSAHDWGLPLVTLWGLAVVPWGDAPGLATLMGKQAGKENYGFAVWFPGLMIALAFAAAAIAKLDSSGIAWVTGGAVKYHFIEDAPQAPTNWGLVVAANDAGAVAMSAGAIAVEALFIGHIFFRSAWVRIMFAIPGLLLLVGFRVLQGVLWTQWWVLFLCFVPWQAIAARLFGPARTVVPSTTLPLGGAAATAVAVLVAIQVFATAQRFEAEPFISDYGMYSWTWPSREAFDAYLARKYRRYVYRLPDDPSAAGDVTSRLGDLAKATDLLADIIDAARAGEPPGERRQQALQSMAKAYRDAYGQPLTRVLVLVDEQVFDWTDARFVMKADDRLLGTLDVATGTFTPAAVHTARP
jgi:hypothetical protein